jgi:hypothetical protein
MRKDRDYTENDIDNPSAEDIEKPTAEDIEIKALADLFFFYRSKYLGDERLVLGKLARIKTNKNYPLFLKLYNYLKERYYYEPSAFIEAQVYWAKKLGHDKYCTPSWLVSEKAEWRYKEFIKIKLAALETATGEISDFKKQVLSGLKNTILFLNKKQIELNLNSIKETMFYKRVNAIVPEIYIWAMNGSICPPYMAISISYNELYNSLDEDIKGDFTNPKDLVTMRQLIILNNELHTFCKSIIPEECNF